MALPIVSQATSNKSLYDLNEIATITATATGHTESIWQYRNKGERQETDWKNIGNPKVEQEYIKIYDSNPFYWQYKNEPIILKGSSISNSLVDGRMGGSYYYISENSNLNDGKENHVTPSYLGWNQSLNYGNNITGISNFDEYKNAIREEFRLLHESGGNFIRLTLADYSDDWVGKDNSLQPFTGVMSSHNFNLSSWNSTWWERLDFVFAEAERKDIIIELEFWDGHDLGGDVAWWENSVWHPNNNTSYTYSSSGLSSSTSWNGRENNPIRAIWTMSNSTVLNFAKAYIKRVLDYCAPYGNIIFSVENEDPSSVSNWANRWADFITANNPYSDGRTIYVTNMRDEYDLSTGTHQTIKNDYNRYSYLDASQHSRRLHSDSNKYDGYYDDIYNFITDVGSVENTHRPVNMAKIYSAYTPPNSWVNDYSMEHGINYYFANIFAGTSGSRFHRPAQNSDYVSPSEAWKCHRAITWLTDIKNIPIWDMIHHHYNSAFTGRDRDGSCYAMHSNNSNTFIMFFDKFEEQVFLNTPNGGTYTISWYNRDTSIQKNIYNKTGTSIEIHKSHGGLSTSERGIIVITKS